MCVGAGGGLVGWGPLAATKQPTRPRDTLSRRQVASLCFGKASKN